MTNKLCISFDRTLGTGYQEFEKTEYAARLKATGVVLSYICPLMYMNNPPSKRNRSSTENFTSK